MKKIITLLVIIASISTTLKTQAQNDYAVVYSLQGGTGSFRGDAVPDDLNPNINLALGVSLEKKLNDHLFLRGGLNYSKKSVSFEQTLFDVTDIDPIIRSTEVDVSVNAITLPIMAGFKTGGSVRFITAAGPFISFIVDEENILSKSLDYGITATLGAEFDLGQGALRVEAFDELGLADINDSQLDIDNNDIKTNRLGLSVSYVMHF